MQTWNEPNYKAQLRKQNFKEISNLSERTKKEIQTYLRNHIQKITRFFDLHYKQIEFYTPFFNLRIQDPVNIQELILASLVGNLFTIHSALELTIKGQFSSAKTLFRKAFEFLMIGKYCGVTKNEKIAAAWLNGSNIDLYALTMKHMINPSNSNIVEFWRILCMYNHGTVYSGPNHTDWKETKEIAECLTFSFMLIACNNHLLRSVVLKNNTSAKYNAEYMRPKQTATLNNLYRQQLKLLKGTVGKAAISFISDYSKVWMYKK